jgi:hypothetical protein
MDTQSSFISSPVGLPMSVYLYFSLLSILLRLFMPATEIEPSPFVVRATGGGTADQRRPSTKPSSLQRATSPTNEYLSSDSDSSSTSDSDILPSNKKDSYSNKGGVRFEVSYF